MKLFKGTRVQVGVLKYELHKMNIYSMCSRYVIGEISGLLFLHSANLNIAVSQSDFGNVLFSYVIFDCCQLKCFTDKNMIQACW